MKSRTPFILFLFLLASSLSFSRAEQHRATHLGNPATRFADPLTTPEDLRARFRDPKLQADMIEILRQAGWHGRFEDVQRAAVTSEIRDVTIAVGAVMPFMSSRENGKPICLRNVTWAGHDPAPAYLFNFTSNGRRCRCVTPKACSNFYVEDLGPEPIPALALDCQAPGEAFFGRPVEVCLNVHNPGTGPIPKGLVHLRVPENMTVAAVANGGTSSQQEITWEFQNLVPKAVQNLCVRLNPSAPGVVTWNASATAAQLPEAPTTCSTRIIGIPAILIDAVDLEDPVQVGNNVTYDIKVTNQGSSEATNVRLLFILPPNEEYVSGGGPTPVQKTDSSLGTDPLAVLAPKGEATWRVVVKASQPGDVRFKIELTSDQFTKPIHEEESTLLY